MKLTLKQNGILFIFKAIHLNKWFHFQAGTGDEFLDKLLSTDSGLDEGGVPDIKVGYSLILLDTARQSARY